MQFDRRITNGLAWAGVLLVVGVPAADYVSAQLMGDARTPQAAALVAEAPAAVPETAVPVATTPAPVPAPVSQRPTAPAPVAQVAAVSPKPSTGNAVDTFMQSGKPLPSYITGDKPAGQAAAAAPSKPAPAPVATQPVVAAPLQQAAVPAQQPAATPSRTPAVSEAETDPIEVAAIPTAPVKVAPVPMPLSMRPQAPAPVVANAEPVVIVPDRVVAPVPPANVSASDLEDWESGPLSEFLASRQQQGGRGNADAYYDADGFYLDEGPNGRPQGDRYIGPADDEVYFPFYN